MAKVTVTRRRTRTRTRKCGGGRGIVTFGRGADEGFDLLRLQEICSVDCLRSGLGFPADFDFRKWQIVVGDHGFDHAKRDLHGFGRVGFEHGVDGLLPGLLCELVHRLFADVRPMVVLDVFILGNRGGGQTVGAVGHVSGDPLFQRSCLLRLLLLTMTGEVFGLDQLRFLDAFLLRLLGDADGLAAEAQDDVPVPGWKVTRFWRFHVKTSLLRAVLYATISMQEPPCFLVSFLLPRPIWTDHPGRPLFSRFLFRPIVRDPFGIVLLFGRLLR